MCRTIDIEDDNVAEPEEERFTVTLDSNDPDVDTDSPDQADVIIIDDDGKHTPLYNVSVYLLLYSCSFFFQIFYSKKKYFAQFLY